MCATKLGAFVIFINFFECLSKAQLDLPPYNSVGQNYDGNIPYVANQNDYDRNRYNVNPNNYNTNQNGYGRTFPHNSQDQPNNQGQFDRDREFYNNRRDLPYNGDIRALLQAIDVQASQQCTNNVAAQWNFETNVNQVTQLDAVKMKPILLHGHERAITQIKYSREGDLLFSASKDNKPTVWFSLNGERLGTFNGHQGAVWCIDVDWTTTKFLSGSGDNSLKIWDIETGSPVGNILTNSSVRACSFSYSGTMAAYSTDKAMGHKCEIVIIDVRDVDETIGESHPILKIPVDGPKVSAVLWGALDETLITGHENGKIVRWDVKTGKPLCEAKQHSGVITDMQMSAEETMLITSSKDHTAKLFDSEDLMLLKTYKTERPVNSAAISPILDHVVLGGGQDAMDVTTTSSRSGKFDARFFHLIFEEEFARVKGHFGPINSLAFHPNGKSYSSGGEDGYVRVNTFDSSYFKYDFEY